MSERWLQLNIDRPPNEKRTCLPVELGQKGDVINLIRSEQEDSNPGDRLETQVQALKKRLASAETRPDTRAFVLRQMTPCTILHTAKR